MNLAGVERGVAAVREPHNEPPVVVDPLGAPAARGPCDLASAQRVARAPRLEDLRGRFAKAPLERREQ